MDIIKPEEVGLSSTQLGRIRTIMQSYVDQNKLAGLLTMVVRRGKVAHFECFGMMDIEILKPMQFDTIFRIYSMQKPIISVAVMMLYEEGHFQLNDPISRFIPDLKDVKVFVKATEFGLELTEQEREMTIQDLLTHTSGLIYGDPEGSPLETLIWEMDQDRRENIIRTPAGQIIFFRTPDEAFGEWIQRLAKLPLAHQPGSRWHYGFSTHVLRCLVEVISRLSFDVFLGQRMFEPLNMVDTAFCVPPDKIGRFATLYTFAKDGGLQVVDAPTTSKWAGSKYLPAGGPGQSLVSTASDYARFAQMMLNKGELDGTRLLGHKTVELMTMNHLPPKMHPFGNTAYGFGLGYRVLMNVAQAGILGSEGMYGWSGGAGTDFWVDPKEELIGIIMPQLMGKHYPIQQEFQMLTYQAIVD